MVTCGDALLMFKIKMAQAKLWKNLVGSISTLVEEGTFTFNENRIKLRAMDPSHVAMVDIDWPKTLFDEYICETETKVCINISEMLKFLRHIKSNESIEISFNPKDARLNIVLSTRYKRSFNMSTLEPIGEEIPTPKISFNARARLASTCLIEAINDASIVSDHIQFEAKKEKLVMHASGDIGEVSVEVDEESEELLNLEVRENSKSTFNLNYLIDSVKAASNVSDIVTLEFSTNMPLRLNFELPQDGRLHYYLAPRIDSDV